MTQSGAHSVAIKTAPGAGPPKTGGPLLFAVTHSHTFSCLLYTYTCLVCTCHLHTTRVDKRGSRGAPAVLQQNKAAPLFDSVRGAGFGKEEGTAAPRAYKLKLIRLLMLFSLLIIHMTKFSAVLAAETHIHTHTHMHTKCIRAYTYTCSYDNECAARRRPRTTRNIGIGISLNNRH